MTKLRIVAAMAASVLTATFGGFEAHAQPSAPVEARNVVLVHGAWADGSSWAEVIPRLQAAGLKVTAVQNPLTSLADSVAATRRALALQDGPTVLVAHSWGGTVISETGTDPKITALVYVAARAPDAGEDFVALSGKFPVGPVRAGIQQHDGFTRLSEESFKTCHASALALKLGFFVYGSGNKNSIEPLQGRLRHAYRDDGDALGGRGRMQGRLGNGREVRHGRRAKFPAKSLGSCSLCRHRRSLRVFPPTSICRRVQQGAKACCFG